MPDLIRHHLLLLLPGAAKEDGPWIKSGVTIRSFDGAARPRRARRSERALRHPIARNDRLQSVMPDLIPHPPSSSGHKKR
jgi:hypothetical protein